MIPPPGVQKNMELSVLLFEIMEQDKDLINQMDGHIVCHIVNGDDDFNYYNRLVAKRRSEAEDKPVIEVVWPSDWREFIPDHS